VRWWLKRGDGELDWAWLGAARAEQATAVSDAFKSMTQRCDKENSISDTAMKETPSPRNAKPMIIKLQTIQKWLFMKPKEL
jgi:hypothetical protein